MESWTLILHWYICKDAIKNNIKIGAYFFSSAITKQEAIEEADYVLDIIKPYKITYPVVIDFEEISGDSYRQENLTTEELTDIIIAFCDKIEKQAISQWYIPTSRDSLEDLTLPA